MYKIILTFIHVRPGEAEGDSAAGRGACGDRPGREPEEGRRDSEARALQVPRVVLQNAAGRSLRRARHQRVQPPRNDGIHA